MNKHIFKRAIIDYRNDGKQLMEKLGKKFDLDVQIESEYEQLISRNNKLVPRKGELSKKWNYSFHGGECGFYNRKYQQSVEVVLSNSPEFGHLDAWFLMKYMISTTKYKDEVEEIEWSDLKPIINELYELGEIENIAR
jgi:hypothetical protein